jgi:exonuclease VII large subunit
VNNKKNSNYFKWFDLANKSRKTDNVEEDFSQFNNDEIMAEVIKRLKKDKLTTEEYKFVSDLPLYEAYYGNLQQELEEKNQKKLQEQEQMMKEKEQRIQEKEQRIQEKEQRIQEKEQRIQEKEQRIQAEHQKLLKGIENLLRRGETIESIAELLVRSIDEITDFVAEINVKKA